MKIKRFVIAVSLVVLSLVMVSGCSGKSEPYNLVVTNNSNESFKSIGFYEENRSGGIINADNSLIKPGEDFQMNIESNEFALSVTDSDDNEYVSDKFRVNISNSKKVYKVSIENDSLGNIEFNFSE